MRGWRPSRLWGGVQRRDCGFTLLELLVVVSIMALATAGAALALRDSAHTQLEREGERLAALLEAAVLEAASDDSKPPIRAVCFDLFGTLLQYDEAAGSAAASSIPNSRADSITRNARIRLPPIQA